MGNTQLFADNGYQPLDRPLDHGRRPDRAGQQLGRHGWTFWQYTSDGTVPGITGRVDLDRYRSPTSRRS